MKSPSPGDKGKSRKRKAKVQPGIVLSWEAFNEEAMRDYLQSITDEIEEQMDELEQALRNLN